MCPSGSLDFFRSAGPQETVVVRGCVGQCVGAWVRGQFLKPEEGSYGHISEGFILAEFYLLRVSIQNLGEWLTCDLALQVNFLYV